MGLFWTSVFISALLPFFVAVLAGDWVVRVPSSPIQAPRGSSVILNCTYDFPKDLTSGSVQKVLSEMWCLNHSFCITPTYVYHSDSIFPDPSYRDRVQYLGTLGSKMCTIKISGLRTTDTGVYVFRFITNHPVDKLPGQNGVMLQVMDPPVNTSVKVTSGEIEIGKSLTLICLSESSTAVANFTWFMTKGGAMSLRGSGQKLTIERVGAEDGGWYTCMAQNEWGSQNATIRIQIEKGGSPGSIPGIVFGIIFMLIAIVLIAIWARRHVVSKSFQTVRNSDGDL